MPGRAKTLSVAANLRSLRLLQRHYRQLLGVTRARKDMNRILVDRPSPHDRLACGRGRRQDPVRTRPRARPAHPLLTAVDHATVTVLAQIDLAEKTNEITGVGPLLDGVADPSGIVITADLAYPT